MRLTRMVRRAWAKCGIAALLAVAVLALSTPATFAAGGVYGTLTGTVVDASTNQPIAGATVVARSPSNTYSATTDPAGKFTILGVAVDTYTVTVTAPGHETIDVPGVNVFGDQINTVSTVALRPHLTTIARVTSRSVASAFQPTQTTDSYTINQNEILQSTGRPSSTNENAALLAVPGVTLTNNNSPVSTQVTIRGAAATEIGYQLDGVPFREPFYHQNASFGLMNGVGNVQVVEGAGDATQAGVGAGVINVIPQRGSGPGSGTLDLGIGGPNFNHEAGISYGFSTPDNRLSEFVSYIGQRLAPYNGYTFTPLNQYGNAFATQYLTNDQVLNNIFYKFGKDLNQQVQVLYMNVNQEGWGGFLGSGGLFNALTNPGALAYYPYDTLAYNMCCEFGVAGLTLPLLTGLTATQYAQLVGLSPGVPSTNVAINQGQQEFSNSTRFLKLEYDNAFSPTTYMALRYYNWGDLQASDASYYQGAPALGTSPNIGQIWNGIGGQTSGINLDLLHQFGSNLTVTLNGQYNSIRPVWNDFSPGLMTIAPIITQLQNPFSTADWLPGGYVFNYFANNAVTVPAQDCSTTPLPAGFKSNCLPRIPTWGINYNGTQFQEWGAGIRLQYNPTDRLHLDLGFREEGQNQHWVGLNNNAFTSTTGFACNGFNPSTGLCSNGLPQLAGPVTPILSPYDVPNSSWTSATLHPTEAEPRASISYQFGTFDSLRFGYGRSAVFADAQTAGTPFGLYGLEPYLAIPAKAGSSCGWAATTVFPCSSYAAQLYWNGDNVEAPDAGLVQPAVYTNYDLSYNHLFKSGYGLRLTPFFKEGLHVPASFLLNPALGIFAIGNQGFNKTTGVELDLTTPQRAIGLSGFIAATYQNVLSTTPPFTFAENAVPLVPLPSLQLGDLYRAGYVSPFDLRIGAVQSFKSGFSIMPVLEFNVGYPYTIGNLIASTVSTGNANVPQVDFGAGTTPGESSVIGTTPGAAISTNYYDPAYPGSIFNPSIAATRGINATAANGGYLSHPNLQANVTFQYKWQRNTVGIQLINLFGNAWINTVPAANPYYQPVATGISGPQTGINGCINQTGPGVRGCAPVIPYEDYAFTNGAYLLSNGNFTSPFVTLGPQQPFAVQLYYQRSF